MAQHGYLREYDERPDRDEDRERSDRDWRERHRDRQRDQDWRSERDRDFMFGDRQRSQHRDRDDDRGFFSRMGDDARSWFGDDDRHDRQDRGAWENNRDWPQRSRGSSGGYGRQGGFSGSNEWREGGRSSSSSHPDDHYRSWRDKQMQALDRDYEDYCREREQQFHRDFDSWRQNRQQQQPQASGSKQPQGSSGQQRSVEESELVLENTRAETPGAGNTPSPMGEATLGTNNSENSSTGRARRSS